MVELNGISVRTDEPNVCVCVNGTEYVPECLSFAHRKLYLCVLILDGNGSAAHCVLDGKTLKRCQATRIRRNIYENRNIKNNVQKTFIAFNFRAREL